MQADGSSAGRNERNINPADINVVSGYQIEVFTYDLDAPVNLMFTDEGDMLIVESGAASGNPRILRVVNNNFEVMADGFTMPITGASYFNGILFVSHRGLVTRILRDGTRQIIISGLPSNGDFFNGRVAIGPDGRKLYFGQGTVTNSGVVGSDNGWLEAHPMLCDYPGDYILLKGQNFETRDTLNEASSNEKVETGAYSPYGVANAPNESRKGIVKASGSILRANLDGTALELYAWGFRNPLNIGFGEGGQLYAANMGYDSRGSRPIANAPDEFFAVTQGLWYGWPDYAAGDPVNLSRYTPEGGRTPELLLKDIPNIPQVPLATFPSNSNIMGFAFNYSDFGPYGDVYITENGSTGLQLVQGNVSYAGIGHRVSKIDMSTRTVSTFAINQSGFPSYITNGGGFGRLVDLAFGPDHAMYILDTGIEDRGRSGVIIPNTGVIWKVVRTV